MAYAPFFFFLQQQLAIFSPLLMAQSLMMCANERSIYRRKMKTDVSISDSSCASVLYNERIRYVSITFNNFLLCLLRLWILPSLFTSLSPNEEDVCDLRGKSKKVSDSLPCILTFYDQELDSWSCHSGTKYIRYRVLSNVMTIQS